MPANQCGVWQSGLPVWNVPKSTVSGCAETNSPPPPQQLFPCFALAMVKKPRKVKHKTVSHVADKSKTPHFGKTQRQCQPRPGQRVATAQQRKQLPLDGNEVERQHDQPLHGSQPSTGIAWADRQRRQHDAWQRSIPEHRAAYMLHLSDAISLKEKIRQQHLHALQQQLNTTWQHHQCSAHGSDQLCCPAYSSFQESGRRSITFYGLEHVGDLQLPVWQCNTCFSCFEPSPSALGCFPNSPVEPSIWFDTSVLELYRRLGLLSGTTCTAFLNGPQHVHSSTSNNSHDGSKPTLKAHQFEAAFCAYCCTCTDAHDLASLGVEGVDSGSFRKCPVCTHNPSGDLVGAKLQKLSSQKQISAKHCLL